MNIKIKATNLELTPSIADYVQKRLEALGKFLESDSAAICEVEVGRTSNHHKQGDVFRAEVRIAASGKSVFAKSETPDLFASIDAVRDEAMRRLTSDKGKRLARIRKGGAMIKSMLKGMWGNGRE